MQTDRFITHMHKSRKTELLQKIFNVYRLHVLYISLQQLAKFSIRKEYYLTFDKLSVICVIYGNIPALNNNCACVHGRATFSGYYYLLHNCILRQQ